MLIFTNIFVIVFLLAMLYVWGLQGWFSALIHLICTIVAGALAFALWEPIAMKLIMPYMLPKLAWSIGLIVPFALILIITRMVIDKLVQKNMRFHQLFGFVGGAACGLASGVLTAGIVLVGLGFLPAGPEVGGYQAYGLSPDGEIVEGEGKVWVPVDKWAVKFFDTLSVGAFAPSFSDVSLRTHRPQLAEQTSLMRLAPDAAASAVALPGEVKIESVYVRDLPVYEIPKSIGKMLGENFYADGYKLVVVDSVIESLEKGGMFDSDDTFRCARAQVALATVIGEGKEQKIEMLNPSAFSQPKGKERAFIPFDSNLQVAWGFESINRIGWVFVVPKKARMTHLFVKNLRIALPESVDHEEDVELLANAIGKPKKAEQTVADAGGKKKGKLGQRIGPNGEVIGRFAEVTSKLPKAVSKNFATRLDVTEDGAIRSGTANVTQNAGQMSRRTLIDRLYVPSHQAMIRIRMERTIAKSLLGKAHASAVALGTIFVRDNQSAEGILPVGYVLSKNSGEQRIHIERIRRVRQLPLNEMEDGDSLYIYFRVGKSRTIETLHIGGSTEQKIGLKVD